MLGGWAGQTAVEDSTGRMAKGGEDFWRLYCGRHLDTHSPSILASEVVSHPEVPSSRSGKSGQQNANNDGDVAQSSCASPRVEVYYSDDEKMSGSPSLLIIRTIL